LKLTDAGRRRLDEALPLWRTAQGAFEERYGAPDSAALRTALSRVVTAL
jgi:hypothetical protein